MDGVQLGGTDGQPALAEAGEAVPRRLVGRAPDRRRRGGPLAARSLEDAPDVAPETPRAPPSQLAVELARQRLVLVPQPLAERAERGCRLVVAERGQHLQLHADVAEPARPIEHPLDAPPQPPVALALDEGTQALQRGQEPAGRRAEVVDRLVDPRAADRDPAPHAPPEPTRAVLDRRGERLEQVDWAAGRGAPGARAWQTHAPRALGGLQANGAAGARGGHAPILWHGRVTTSRSRGRRPTARRRRARPHRSTGDRRSAGRGDAPGA